MGRRDATRAPTASPRPRAARAVKAKALDLLRGLLPAASLSHMGIYATGQAYEQLILHLLAHPLPEARRYGELILEAVKAVMPSFVARVERPDRGGEWVAYLERARARPASAGPRGSGSTATTERRRTRPSVRLLHVDGDEDALLAALLFEAAGVPRGAHARRRRARSPTTSARALLADLVGERANRRHRPGRGFEALRYRFEIVSDYGAFRDLQRHRMLTVQWQALTPDLGAGVPEEVVAAGVRRRLPRARSSARAREYERLAGAGLRRRARRTRSASATASATCSTSTRARRCTSSSCAPAARATRATAPSPTRCTRRSPSVHPAVAAAMTHVDTDAEPRLERILSEMRTERRRASTSLH